MTFSMKILLTGGSGQLGKEILKSKPRGIEIINPSSAQLDLSDYLSCMKTVLDSKPDWIINCAAYTKVDEAEKNIKLSNQVNSFAPAAFTEAINKMDTKLLHISTDFVFDGNQNFPYEESQTRNPLSQYGTSKALGEELIEKKIHDIEKITILRTSWVISPRGKNFVLTMLKLHSEKDYIDVVSDQIGSPTSTYDLAKVCWKIIEVKRKEKLPHILHWSDSGVTSWYDIAVAVGDLAEDLKIIEKKAMVNPISTYEYPTPAKRPLYSILNTSNTSKVLDLKPNYWRDNLKNILIEYQKKGTI